MVSATRIQKNLTVTLTATIPESRQLVINLPEDTPTGQAEININIPIEETVPPMEESGELTREEFRARLRAAGLLVEEMPAEEVSNPALEAAREKFRVAGKLVIIEAPDSDYLMSDEELWALADQITDGPSVDEIMKDIRGEY